MLQAPLVPVGPELALDDVARFSRQILLPELGTPGQRRLAAARVLVVGAGGLGSPALLYLAAAGVGTIGIVDSDVVELSNLHRQVIHGAAAIGHSKVDSAAGTLAALNPGVRLIRHPVRLDEHNAAALVAGYDVVVDGADNFPTRYLVNDACARAGLPLVWGSVLGFAAQVAVFWDAAPDGAGVQLRDVFPTPPPPGSVPSCAEAGVIGALCGQVGSIMAGEVIKLITGIGEPLLGRLLVIDMLRGRWDQVAIRRRSTPAPAPLPATEACRSADPSLALPDPVPPDTVLLDDPAHAGELLLDVRTAAEFAQSHVRGSVNLPLSVILAGDDLQLPTDRTILVICRSGARAEVAATALRARGFVEVRVLTGGLLALGG